MVHDNPYAAPQTIESRVAPSALPQAEATERKHFPDTSTLELRRLANWSIPIEAMSLLWGVCWVFVTIAFCMQLGTNPQQWYWGGTLLLVGLRVWGGSARSPRFWAYDLLVDVLFAVALLWGAFKLAQFDLLALLLVGGVKILLFALAILSIIAHLVARPLYGKFTQRELVDELGSRSQQKIQ